MLTPRYLANFSRARNATSPKRGQQEQEALLLGNRGGGVGVVAALQNAGSSPECLPRRS
jgi:hypothetical protein